ncbi:MAG: SpoIIE family protein phosphatase [Clostridia bacterium]|nr:SpoIIE family protein phosphatase [Clostridia bacterium]
MAEKTMNCMEEGEITAKEENAKRENGFIDSIAKTLEHRGRLSQKILCLAITALFSLVQLPGGGYCCQAAMFAVFVRLGLLVPSAFFGVLLGFAYHFAQGDMYACWQMPVCIMLWLSCGVWARREKRIPMAAAVFVFELTFGVFTGMNSVLELVISGLTAVSGAAFSLLYDGAVFAMHYRDELDGDTRPLCMMAVCACAAAGVMRLPYGSVIGASMALYLTLEHAYIGGASQAILCAGVLGGVVSLGQRNVQTCFMLLAGGFLAGEIKSRHRSVCVLLMLSGMAAASALLGADLPAVERYIWCLPGMLPFLLLSSVKRAAVTGMIEQPGIQEMTQSEAIAIRNAAMVHAWAGLYENTAQMMKSLCAPLEENAQAMQCVELLHKTSTAAHQVCERMLSEIHPDDEAYRRIRYALVRAGLEQVRPAYALFVCERREVMLLKPEHIAPVSLEKLISGACGTPMRAVSQQGLLSTQALYEQTPALRLEIGAAILSCSGEEVAGDSYISRTLAGGQHVLALSDGMGSGFNAMQESQAALSLVAESLKAGYTRAQALQVVNALMLMCTGREMYATLDLCVINLHTGEAAFEKLGACPAYVVRDAQVRTIGAETLPVGVLPDVESGSLRMTLREGDVVILMTDGVQENYPGGREGLEEAVEKIHWLHPQAIGEKLIEQVLLNGGAKDDMAVLCARVIRGGTKEI